MMTTYPKASELSMGSVLGYKQRLVLIAWVNATSPTAPEAWLIVTRPGDLSLTWADHGSALRGSAAFCFFNLLFRRLA